MRSKQYDILVVDDDPEDRMIIGEAFAELNCADRVTMYESGPAFHTEMLQLKTLSPLPLLIVLDYNLPGPDGSIILDLLQNDPVLHSIPVLMYSTGMSRTQKIDCRAKGAMGCFEKGAVFAEVISFCRELICLAEKTDQVS
jgi:two-component system chemotaxis response regulator CheY